MLEVQLRNTQGVSATLVVARSPLEVKRIVTAKKPLNKAMDQVRRALGSGHGFFPVSDVYEVA